METRELGERIAAAKREIRARSLDGVERRTFPAKVLARAAGDGWQIEGHGLVYNSLSENLGGFREVIQPGAADDVLAGNPDIRGLINHDPNLILGRTRAGTMTVEDDPGVGVSYVIDPPDTSYANDLRVSLERGDITQSSFAFRVARGGDIWEEDEDTGGLLRTVTRFSALFDMSPVTYPAYEETDVGLASHTFAVTIDGVTTEHTIEKQDPKACDHCGARCVTSKIRDGGGTFCDGCTAPDAERVNDEPAEQRVDGGGDEETAADGRSALEQRKARLTARIGEPPLT